MTVAVITVLFHWELRI